MLNAKRSLTPDTMITNLSVPYDFCVGAFNQEKALVRAFSVIVKTDRLQLKRYTKVTCRWLRRRWRLLRAARSPIWTGRWAISLQLTSSSIRLDMSPTSSGRLTW